MGKLLILVGVYLITEFLFIYIASGFVQLLYHLDLFSLVQKLSSIKSVEEINATERAALQWYQAITSVGRFLSVSLLFVYLAGESWRDYLVLRNLPTQQQILLIPLLMIAAGLCISGIQEWNANMHLPAALHDLETQMRTLEDQAKLQTDIFLQADTIGALLINILIICVIAAIGEEFLFRGIIQQTIFRGTGKAHAAIWVSAFIFSFIHLQFYGFFPRFILGALLGYLLYYSSSMWAPVLAHFLNNLISVLAFYGVQSGKVATDVEQPAPWWASLIALPFVFLMLLYYIRNGKTQTLPYGKGLDDNLHDNRQDAGELPAE